MALETFGTKKVGYVAGKYGPFRCDHCVHFVSTVSGCTDPRVMADNEVPQEDGKLRYAKVDKDGCCNEWFPKSEHENASK